MTTALPNVDPNLPEEYDWEKPLKRLEPALSGKPTGLKADVN